HGLRKTPIRTEILDLFMKHDCALSAGEISAKLKTDNDRVTVYRALASFEQHGILHKASEDRQGVKYALGFFEDTASCTSEPHAHFVCEKCHQTYCLKDVKVPELDVSSEFSIRRIDFKLSGICKHCQSAEDPTFS
ncbi:MAG: transcriptional repressor, partial [Bacteroidota bacterium]